MPVGKFRLIEGALIFINLIGMSQAVLCFNEYIRRGQIRGSIPPARAVSKRA